MRRKTVMWGRGEVREKVKRIALALALVAVAIGVLTATGWALGVDALRWLGPGPQPVHPLTALIVIAVGLGVRIAKAGAGWRGVVAAAGVAALGASAAGLRLAGVDPFGAGFHPSYPTAGIVLLLGAALFASARGQPRGSEALALLAAALCLPGMLRHLVGAADDLALTRATWISFPAALGLLLASLSLVISQPGGTVATLLASPKLEGVVARRLLPAAVVIPVVLGLVRLGAERAGVLSPELGLTMLISSGMVLISTLVTLTALSLGRVEQAREAAQRELELRSAQLAEAQALSHLGSFSLAADARSMEWSDELYRVLGRSPEDTRPTLISLLDRVLPVDRARVEQLLRGLTPESPPAEAELQVLGPQGELRDVHLRARALAADERALARVVGTLQDVSERKRVERESAEREESLRVTLNSIGDAVVATRADATVHRLNPIAERLTGWTMAEAAGQPLNEVLRLISEKTRAPVENPVERVLREGKVVGLANHTALVRRDGTERPIADSAAPIRDERGNIQGVVLVLRDVTEERLVEEERERLRARLVAADRLASLGTLAAGVAHEINNPLSYVCSNLDFLWAGGVAAVERACEACPCRRASARPVAPLDAALSEVRVALEDCMNGAERVRRIVRDIKLFSRVEEERTELVDLRQVVQSSIQLAQGQLRDRGTLHTELNEVPPVRAASARLGQVVLNLLANAAQALPPERARENAVWVRTRQGNDGQVILEVEDNGAGIPPTVLPRLFEPFFTTKPVGQGTGLGLSISHGVVASLGGEIAVKTEVGKGSTFRVVLPPASEALGSVVLPPRTHMPARRGRVLIIDDEELIGRALVRSLQPDHDAVAVVDARAALERLLQHEHFDAILCDLMMPELSGMELHQALVAKLPEVAQRVVFMTGGAFTPEARTFIDTTQNLHLAKPINPNELSAALRKLIR